LVISGPKTGRIRLSDLEKWGLKEDHRDSQVSEEDRLLTLEEAAERLA